MKESKREVEHQWLLICSFSDLHVIIHHLHRVISSQSSGWMVSETTRGLSTVPVAEAAEWNSAIVDLMLSLLWDLQTSAFRILVLRKRYEQNLQLHRSNAFPCLNEMCRDLKSAHEKQLIK